MAATCSLCVGGFVFVCVCVCARHFFMVSFFLVVVSVFKNSFLSNSEAGKRDRDGGGWIPQCHRVCLA